MNTPHVDYLESLFQGIDIIVDKKLENVSYDTTIVCTIVDDSERKNGEYIVNDGTIRFKAYSENIYKVDDQVRVSIPNGDFTGTKFIVGKYISDKNVVPITYVSPLESIVDITGNLFSTDIKEYETEGIKITANGLEANRILLNKDLPDSTFSSLQENEICSAVYLKADFQTLFAGYDITEGTYGLRLDLLIKPTSNSRSRIHQYIELSSNEMFGNPYSFGIFTPQSKVVSIKNIGTIDQIILSVFQNGDFKDRNKGYIDAAIFPNISVKNIEIGFGSDLSNIEDNVLKIYSLDDLLYSYQGQNVNYDSTHNTKSLNLLWYNKNESNKYLGFSDGIYSPDYDEIEYLNKSRENERLMLQKGKVDVATDEDSLRLSANLSESSTLLTQAKNYIDKDLMSILKQLILQFPVEDTTNRQAVTVAEEQVLEASAAIVEAVIKMGTQYQNVLKYGYKAQPNPNNPSLEWRTEWEADNYGSVKDSYVNIQNIITNLFADLQVRINDETGTNNGYQGVHDVYLLKCMSIFEKMNVHLSKVDVLVENDINVLRSYNQQAQNKKTNWVAYKNKDFSSDDNKYCIYWYRYEKGYTNPDEMFMEDGWRRISSDMIGPPGTDIHNLGLPGPGETIKNQTYYQIKPENNDSLFNINMRNDEDEEKFIAIIFYNHEMFKSNELVFLNDENVIDEETLDKSNVIAFEHLHSSRKDYYIYSNTNYLLDLAEAYKFRTLRCHYDGALGGDELLNGAGIYWYVPRNSSMIDVNVTELKSRGFTTDYEKPTQQSREGYWYFYKTISATDTGELDEDGNPIFSFLSEDGEYDTRDFWYRIKPYFESDCRKNVIECEIHLQADDNPIYGEEYFSFGVASTNGTKYTLVVTNATDQMSCLPNADLLLDVSLRDYGGTMIDIYRDGSVVDGNITSGFNSDWYFELENSGPVTVLPENRTTPVKQIKVAKNSCGILNNTVTLKDKNYNNGIVDLQCLYAVPQAAADYYLSGPTTVIYNSQGTIDNKTMFDSPYKLFWGYTNQSHKANDEINVIWTIEYYKPDGTVENDAKILRYMPRLNEVGGLTPAPMFVHDLNCFAVVCALNAEGEYLWRQPIIVLQNRFGSTLLNNWDGSLQIDETNGSILATMIGAGRKEVDNSFSGVLMGDVTTENVESEDKEGIGLYGFHHGAQSFGLNVDGTAFFGKSGRGRIEIDGDNSVIRSSGWTRGDMEHQWVAPESGTLLDLDDAILLMRDSTEGSDETPARESYLYFNRDGEGKLEILASGIDIKLNNKGSVGLSPYIETSAQRIVAEVRRSANYYGTCVTESSFIPPVDGEDEWDEIESNKTKIVNLDLDVGDAMIEDYETEYDYGIRNIEVTDILKTGTTIAVTFTSEQHVKETITISETETVPGTEHAIPTKRDIVRVGHTLVLSINNAEKPVYFNQKLTAEDNPYGWLAGSTVYFTFDEEVDAWFVTDSGAYSRTTQTADYIRSEVANDITATATSITQTANSIRSEARQYAGYYGDCEDNNQTTIKRVKVKNLPSISFDLADLLQNGIGLAVTFSYADVLSVDRELKLQLGNNAEETEWNEKQIPIVAEGGAFSWEAGSTVYFVYNNEKWIVSDAGSYSRITQTANAITSEVRRTATYNGTCNTEDSYNGSNIITENQIKVIDLINVLKDGTNVANSFTPVTEDEIYQTGITVAITFTYGETPEKIVNETDSDEQPGHNGGSYNYKEYTENTKGRALTLNAAGKNLPIFINGEITSEDNPFGWTAGSVVYFTYDANLGENGAWKVSDSGAYSNITQTADSIKSTVQTLDNRFSSQIEQTVNSITSEVRRTAGYICTYPNVAPDGGNTYTVVMQGTNVLTNEDILQSGVTLAVTFDRARVTPGKLLLQVKHSNGTTDARSIYFKNGMASEDNPFTWEIGDTIHFTYFKTNDEDGYWKVVDSGAYSKIQQTADAITAEVRGGYGYPCTGAAGVVSTTDPDGYIFTITFINEGHLEEAAPLGVFKDGTILNVLFDARWDAETTQANGAYLKFNNINQYFQIYSNNAAVSKSAPYGWASKSNVQFKVNTRNSRQCFEIINAGSYSKLTQTAQNINATVSTKLDQHGGKNNGAMHVFGWNLTADGFYLGPTETPGPTDANTTFICDEGGLTVNGALYARELHIEKDAICKGQIRSGEIVKDINAQTYSMTLNSSSKVLSGGGHSNSEWAEYWNNLPKVLEKDANGEVIFHTLRNQYLTITPNATINIKAEPKTTFSLGGKSLELKNKNGTLQNETLDKNEPYQYMINFTGVSAEPVYELREIKNPNYIPPTGETPENPDSGDQTTEPEYITKQFLVDYIYKCTGAYLTYLPEVPGMIIDLTAGTIELNKTLTVNGTGVGYITIGAPLDSSSGWDEVSVMPMGGSRNYPIGNLGVPGHPWDMLCIRGINYYSDRNMKTNVSLYNNNNAYDEMKNMPIYTYNYSHDSVAAHNSPAIGTMIDYIPNEAMGNDGEYTSIYSIESMIFWDIAATKVVQEKLEKALDRIEELEIKLEEMQNGIN